MKRIRRTRYMNHPVQTVRCEIMSLFVKYILLGESIPRGITVYTRYIDNLILKWNEVFIGKI